MFKSLLFIVFLVVFITIILMILAKIFRSMVGKSIKGFLTNNKSGLEGLYRHYKGAEYEVIGIATNATNEEEMVVYRKQDNGMWVRPRADFEGFTLVDGAQVRRFTKI